MNDDKVKILKAASDIFFSRGFYKIPVDDIASLLKMSKKTIYKHFPTKENLVREVAYLFIKTHSSNIAEIINHDYNAVEKLFYIFNYLGNMLININDKWFSDRLRPLRVPARRFGEAQPHADSRLERIWRPFLSGLNADSLPPPGEAQAGRRDQP